MRSTILADLRMRFSREQWNLGFVRQPVEHILRHGITTPVQWLSRCKPWRMLADPFCLYMPDGTLVILAEHLNHWVGRGEIWRAVISGTDDPVQTEFEPWMASNIHLSYPFLVRDDDGSLCLLVESYEAGALHLWRERDGAFALVGPIIDRPVVDATPWRDESGWWLFCTLESDGPNERLQLFHAVNLTGPWVPHRRNPVKIDKASGRPAGPLFVADGKLIRPAQDCSSTYGGAVVLNEVKQLDCNGFHEEPLRRLGPEKDYPNGLHSICSAGEMTIIDGKRWEFQPLDMPRRLITSLQNHSRPFRRPVLPRSLARVQDGAGNS
jgi:hypothetical protein